jgi:hypothetical protein
MLGERSASEILLRPWTLRRQASAVRTTPSFGGVSFGVVK